MTLLAFAQFVISVDYNIVFVAMPRIARDLHFSPQAAQWVISAYVVAYGGFLLLGGRVADLFGRRRLYMIGMGLFAVSSLAGTLAVAPWMLIASRAMQGLGGAALFPAAQALINTLFAEGRERHRAQAVCSGLGSVGLSLGALLGGVLTVTLGWRAVFAVNVPIAGAAALAALRVLPRDPPGVGGRRTLDLPGAVTVTSGVTLIVIALVQGPDRGWLDRRVLAVALAGGLLVAAFVAVEARSRAPLMRLELLVNRHLSTAAAVMFLAQGLLSTIFYFLTLYFQEVRGEGPLATGLAFLPLTLVGAAFTPLTAATVTRFGVRRAMLAGQLATAVGVLSLTLALAPGAGLARLLPGMVIISIGCGLTWNAMFNAAAIGVPAAEQGVAAGMASTARQTGSAVGLAALVAIAAAAGDGTVAEGVRAAGPAVAALPLLGALITVIVLRHRAAEVVATES